MNDLSFSLITPTHDPKYIKELYDSILDQTYTNWEWIIYLNGNATKNDLSEEIINDSKIKIYIDDKNKDKNTTKIGYIKNKAFHLGSNDILVEVDHDDLLTPDCLEELNIAFNQDDVGFVYSDNAKLHMKDAFKPYSSYYGWTYDMFNWKGKELYQMHSFPPSSRSLAFIWYAPDHVRAWRKTVYKSIGGHNQELSVLDDQELMIRTYLVTKFHQIERVLYIYRITGDNTWLERNQEIQTGTVELFKKYAFVLAERESDLNGWMKVDLGGGINPKPGYVVVDQVGGDIACDLNGGIPLPDNSVGIINASHVIEHLKDPVKTMSEIHRVLVDGGWVMIEVPSTDGRGAWQDPTHVSYWNQNSFMYYTKSEQAKYIRNDKIRFQSFRCETGYPNKWFKDNDIPVVFAWLCALKGDMKRCGAVEV